MIDLKEEIEKLQTNLCERILDQDETYLQGMSIAYENCLMLCDQHNIITAPKEIKLSEIVSKFVIKDSFYKNHRISVIRDDNDIDVWEDYDIEVDETTLSQSNLLVVISNNKIEEINISYRYENLNKWLYTLWIAGSKIIDDLEGNE